MWAADACALLSLAFVNADGEDSAVVSWHHCMNVVFPWGC